MENPNTSAHQYNVPRRVTEVPANLELHSQEITALTQLGEVPAEVAAKATGHTALDGAELLPITHVKPSADRNHDRHLTLH